MSGTKKFPDSTSIRYDATHRAQAETAYRHHLALVGRSDEPFTFSDVIDWALVLFIDMQGDVEASASLFRATAMEEIMRSHVLLQSQLEVIHETLYALRNPPPDSERDRQQWSATAVAQIEAQVTSALKRIPKIHQAILRDEKQIAESIRKRRETLRSAVRIVREKMNEEAIIEAMQRAVEE
jgi:cob(I)alamin adenosyltransferase